MYLAFNIVMPQAVVCAHGYMEQLEDGPLRKNAPAPELTVSVPNVKMDIILLYLVSKL